MQHVAVVIGPDLQQFVAVFAGAEGPIFAVAGACTDILLAAGEGIELVDAIRTGHIFVHQHGRGPTAVAVRPRVERRHQLRWLGG